jgi:hypothetical protein
VETANCSSSGHGLTENGWTVVRLVDEITPRDDGLDVTTIARMEREGVDGAECSTWRIAWSDHRRPQAVRYLVRAQAEGLVVVIPEGALDGGELLPEGAASHDDGQHGNYDQDDDQGDQGDPDDDYDVMGEDDLRAVVQDEIRKAIAAHELRVAIASGVLGLLLLAGTWHAIWLAR